MGTFAQVSFVLFTLVLIVVLSVSLIGANKSKNEIKRLKNAQRLSQLAFEEAAWKYLQVVSSARAREDPTVLDAMLLGLGLLHLARGVRHAERVDEDDFAEGVIIFNKLLVSVANRRVSGLEWLDVEMSWPGVISHFEGK